MEKKTRGEKRSYPSKRVMGVIRAVPQLACTRAAPCGTCRWCKAAQTRKARGKTNKQENPLGRGLLNYDPNYKPAVTPLIATSVFQVTKPQKRKWIKRNKTK